MTSWSRAFSIWRVRGFQPELGPCSIMVSFALILKQLASGSHLHNLLLQIIQLLCFISGSLITWVVLCDWLVGQSCRAFLLPDRNVLRVRETTCLIHLLNLCYLVESCLWRCVLIFITWCTCKWNFNTELLLIYLSNNLILTLLTRCA